MNLLSFMETNRSKMMSCSRETGVVAGTGNESVDGRFTPGRVERRTFIVGVSMAKVVYVAVRITLEIRSNYG